MKKINTEKGEIYVWKRKEVKDSSADKRLKQEIDREEVRKKVNELFPESSIEHSDSGAPLFINNKYPFISISHYRGWYCMYLSLTPIGVDIQPYRKFLLKGKDYFVNAEEEQIIELSDFNLHCIWCAKEAFYKQKLGAIQDLKEEVVIIAIDEEEQQLTLKYKGEESILYFYRDKEYLLMWT